MKTQILIYFDVKKCHFYSVKVIMENADNSFFEFFLLCKSTLKDIKFVFMYETKVGNQLFGQKIQSIELQAESGLPLTALVITKIL